MPQSVAMTTSAPATAMEVGTLCRRVGSIVSLISKSLLSVHRTA
jgi:hypothetical protein